MKKFVLSLLLLLFTAATAFAVPTANSFITPQFPTIGYAQFSSPNVSQTVITGGLNGTQITGLWATSSDAANTHVIVCQYVHASTSYGGGAVTIGVGGGLGSPAAGVNLLSQTNWVGLPVDASGNPYLYLAPGDSISCLIGQSFSAAGLVVNVMAQGANY